MRSNRLLPFVLVMAALFVLSWGGCTSRNSETPATDQPEPVQGRYPDPVMPISTAQIFAENIVSTGLNERDLAISPDGSEIFFTIWTGLSGTIVSTKRSDDDTWPAPETVAFSGHYSDMEPFLSFDGNRLFFASNRPNLPGGESKDFDIWYVERSGSGWSEPVNAGPYVNSDQNEFYPSVAENGNLYFTATRPEGLGSEDLYVSSWTDGLYTTPENVGAPVSSQLDEFNAIISPDESRLIFTVWGRQDDFGGGDLYVSFRGTDGLWGTPLNMGEDINSSSLDFCPAMSPDGEVFFFTSRRNTLTAYSEEMRTYDSLVDEMNAPGNGAGDIYWIPAAAVDSLNIGQ